MDQILLEKINLNPNIEGKARAEYVNQGQGWQLTPPLGIYPL